MGIDCGGDAASRVHGRPVGRVAGNTPTASRRPGSIPEMEESGRLAALMESPDLLEVKGIRDFALLRRFLAEFETVLDERHLEDLDDQEGRRLAAHLVDTYQFLQKRRPTQMLVRVLQPMGVAESRSASCNAEQGRSRDEFGTGIDDESVVLEVCLRDQPFIVDTIELYLEHSGIRFASRQSISLPLLRDSSGRLSGVEEEIGPGKRPEVIARFELIGEFEREEISQIESDVLERLKIAQLVVRHFKRMKGRLREIARNYKKLVTTGNTHTLDPGLLAETRVLIDWLLDENFVLLGISRYSVEPGELPIPEEESGSGFEGINGDDQRQAGLVIDRMEREQRFRTASVVAFKGLEESLIHRAGKIDHFILRDLDPNGNLVGYFHLRGLFTYKAIQTLGSQIPLVRRTLSTLLSDRGLTETSVRGKAYINSLNSIPVEFLFQAHDKEIDAIVQTILYVERSKELRSYVTIDEKNQKGLYFLVLPRQSYSEEQRRRIESILFDELGATYSDSRVNLGKYGTVLLSFFFTANDRFREFSRDELDERVRSVAGTWEERLTRQLDREFGRRSRHLFPRYRSAFPDEYRAVHTPAEAVADIGHLERVRPSDGPGMSFEVFHSREDLRKRRARLRLYLRRNVYLSTVLPVLDNFGLQVMEQAAFPVELSDGESLYIHTFHVAGVDRDDHPLVLRKAEFLEALDVVFHHCVGNDPLNRLVIEAGLNWQDVDLLRSYLHYLRQLGVSITNQFAANTLRQHSGITRLLIEFHRLRHDPDLPLTLSERRDRARMVEAEIERALIDVPSSAHDHFIRVNLDVLKATLRTTRYQERSRENYLVAFKIDSRVLKVGGEPRPWREIYVHHYSMEGIHLRGGKLARGGIRWSDRVTDFRDEILGLQQTQMVKNVLIVPVGAKGGFVLRHPAPDYRTRREQADRLYRVFIGALLDLTDNVIDGEVAPPERVVRHDPDDPYMVVAADKGTAHLSDAANEISLERGFWLGDAFASGGSNGYDHKALAITARGAWEGVRRHFHERGIDPETDAFTAVGIGDMSGDVFGNGMLLSKQLHLLAAFNHQHIFIDPDPDPERSFAERERLFELPQSSWEDYDEDCLSPGGQVFSRHTKTVRLSPQAKALLGIERRECDPSEVIRAILTMEVDLLWNGGIGTYIRASAEDDRDVGDLSNAAVRVDARKVRAKTIGEGGNLGLTQRGRVQFALRGGRINTDFVDNSGGVDCSDHEVNLKILLSDLVVSGKGSLAQRNQILASLEEEICNEVLSNNSDQGRMISLDELRAVTDPFAFERVMKTLEDRGWIDRDRESLPNLETLTNRQAQGIGLTRPELAVISAYAKMHLFEKLQERSDQLEQELKDDLLAYFPDSIRESFGDLIPNHLLAREISLTVLTNRIVDYAGGAFVIEAQRETGRTAAEIAYAYLVVDRIFEAPALRRLILEQGRLEARSEYQALLAIEEANRRAVSWLLADVTRRFEKLAQGREEFQSYLREYRQVLLESLSVEEKERYQEAVSQFKEAGFESDLAARLADCLYLTAGLRIADIARETGAPIDTVTALYYQLGSVSYIHPMVRRFDENVFVGRWETLALRIVRNSLLDSLWGLVVRLVKRYGPVEGDDWVAKTIAEVKKRPLFRELGADMRRLGREEITIAALQVLSVRLARIVG